MWHWWAAEVVAFQWARDALRRHQGRGLPIAAALSALVVVLLVTPGFYASAWFDFHSQTIATLFALLAARDLYNAKIPRAALWVGLMLLCGDVAATYVVALGMAATVSSRRTRAIGIAMVVVGVAWVLIIAAFGPLGIVVHERIRLPGQWPSPRTDGHLDCHCRGHRAPPECALAAPP